MNILVRQFLTLLAASNFDRRQVNEMLREIYKTSPRKMVFEFDAIRKRLMDVDVDEDLRTIQQPDDEMMARIFELVAETGLSKTEAYDLLVKYLGGVFPERFIAPPNSKAGFSAWIKSLSKEFTASELLHVVTRMRNDKVHGLIKKDDWLHRNDLS
ncbi:hypothetical protein ISG25_18520 [Burkholderia pseudomallei]|nr:hypothetical protein [Burkholderia pseudomallei]MBF3724560.1 hypothetical protein [Burkholderia pseudomallei]